MAKVKTAFVCQACGAKAAKWLGRCPSCGEWNSYAKEREEPAGRNRGRSLAPASSRFAKPLPLAEVPSDAERRILTGLGEFDRVLGGGLVPGSAVLVGGDPGVGKSTLLLQAASRLAASGAAPLLYVAGEESARQVRLRADRLGVNSAGILVYPETDASALADEVPKIRPAVVVVDSIQALHLPELESAPGSVAQVRECAARLAYLAKRERFPLLLVGHVTKEGALAGPMVLEHLVDAVLLFEGDPERHLRILRARKNRFGSVQEIGLFTMGDDGLREVPDAASVFLEPHAGPVPGSAVAAALEGSRPLLVEVQALVAPSSFATPQRRSSGFDATRLSLVLAILEKRLGMLLSAQDVFLNLAGGLKASEPALDLAVALAAASSFRDAPIPPRTAVFGEVGLSGEVRAVAQADLRLREAARLGFSRVVLPDRNAGKVSLDARSPVEVVGVKTLAEAVELLLR